ncbi:PqiC family protein [Candidatus Accumulibacter sp. ACC003]|uniref:PqiC family protein n=1 Tax=Candidatus Accumulibacter sp. ACC003 TaxID=2823334 RepID=UPI0025BCCE6C|nr:PqiC family protein [Candidatus Accumulibacter sp. ACC003]
MRHLTVIACLLLAIVSACASPPSRFYTLSAATAGAGSGSAATLSVAVGPVSLPAVVDRPQIVVNSGANEVRLDEFNRWAGPLQDNIARVLAGNLAQELGTARVWPYGQTAQSSADYQVLIDVQRFDSTLGDAVLIEALWTVRPAAGGASKSGRSQVRETIAGSGFEPLVAAHSRALARVSSDIAAAIRAP